MKILAIRFNNLASLQGITEIDFSKEPLYSAGIFAITGPTGAGKSTILDALCLALYSKTPRYHKANESGLSLKDASGSSINQGDIRGILRDGSGEGWAEVDFIGIDHARYRSKWSVKRARSKPDGALQADNLELKNLETNSAFAERKHETLREIERLVGLNYDQFTRSVLLAQGEFTAFLKAAKDEKASLLEKLTGTKIYSEISKIIFEKSRTAKDVLRQLREQIGGIHSLTIDEITQLNEQKTTIHEQISQKKIEIKKLEKESEWHISRDQFVNSLQKSEALWHESVQRQELADQRILRLRQIDEVQRARSLFEGRTIEIEKIQNKSEELKNIKANLETLIISKEKSGINHAQVELDLFSKKTFLINSQPLLQQARKLDVQLINKKQELEKAIGETVNSNRNMLLNTESLIKIRNEASLLSTEIDDLENWKNKHRSRQALAENIPLIEAKLIDAAKFLFKIEQLEYTLTQENREVENHKKNREVFHKNQIAEQAAWEKCKGNLSEIEKALSALPILQLNARQEKLLQLSDNSNLGLSLWRDILRISNIQSELQARISLDEQRIIENEVQFREVSIQLIESGIRKENSAKMLIAARLKASQNVIELRSRLISDEACPVCGSTEHPFIEHNPMLDLVFSSLEEQVQQNESDYNDLNRNAGNLKGLGQSLAEQIVMQKLDLEKKSAEFIQANISFQSAPIFLQCERIPDKEKEKWLQTNCAKIKADLIELKQQIDEYHKNKQKHDELEFQLKELGKKVAELEEILRVNSRKIESIEENELRLKNEVADNKKLLEELENSLSPYFQQQIWIENWKSEPDEFLIQVKSFALKWKQNAENSKNALDHQIKLKARIESLESAHSILSLDFETKDSYRKTLESELSKYSTERQAILNGRNAADFENECIAATEKAQNRLLESSNEMTLLQNKILALDASKTHFNADLYNSEKLLAELKQKIQAFLHEFNKNQPEPLEENAVLDLLNHSFNWREDEKTALQSIKDEVTSTLSRLNERKHVLQEHEKLQNPLRSRDELEEIIRDNNSILEEETKSCNELEYRLKTDSDNKSRIGDFVSEIEQKQEIAENWEKLNELIGSLDGKKFRQLAQEYTLDILLAYANQHLKMLTKRYTLDRVPESLGMQICDKDMGNEIRTVFSLSGGESFLVSLALALGLASLSSKNMKVESLFIDEGFGSLDPMTLNIAMDALEQLHSQGRKVGVISHVQEMTERIPTQIVVSKLSSGRSKIDVKSI